MSKLQSEVIAFVQKEIASHPRINKPWLVQAFISQKGDLPDGEYDRDFYRQASYYAVSDAAGRAIKKAGDVDPVETPQLTLPGYDRLQVAYSVKSENGDVELVQTHLIADDVLLGRAKEYDDQARGLAIHAEEIRRYVQNRSQMSLAQ